MICSICKQDVDDRPGNWARLEAPTKCISCKRAEAKPDLTPPPLPPSAPVQAPEPHFPKPDIALDPEALLPNQVASYEAMSPDERQEFHLALEGPDGYTGAKCVVCGKHRHPEDIAFNSDTGPSCVDCNYVRPRPSKKQGKRKRKAREDGKIEAIDVSKGAIKVLKELVKGRPELSVYLELGELESKSGSNKMVKTYFYGATLKDMSSLMDFKMNYYEKTEKKAISSLKQTIQILEEGGGRSTDVWGPPAPRAPKCKTCGRNTTEDGEGGKCGACVALEADDLEPAPPPKKRGRPKGKGKRKDPDPVPEDHSPPCQSCGAESGVFFVEDGKEFHLCSPCYEKQYPEEIRKVPPKPTRHVDAHKIEAPNPPPPPVPDDEDPDDGSSGADPWTPPPRRGRPSKKLEAAAAPGQGRLF